MDALMDWMRIRRRLIRRNRCWCRATPNMKRARFVEGIPMTDTLVKVREVAERPARHLIGN